MFPDFGTYIRATVNDFVNYLVINFGDTLEALSDALLVILLKFEWLLLNAPEWAVIAVIAVIAYIASRRIGLAIAMALATYFIGTLGLWPQTMQTIALTLTAVILAILIGVPIGILMTQSTIARICITPILDLMQTIPSFVYLIPAAMLFGLGKVPAILATIIYSMPPLIRLTDLGIRMVDTETIEAASAFGAKRWQILKKVQIPLAMPSIMQGVNQTMMMALAMVVIASMIGARGIGETVLLGLQRNDSGLGFIGGIAIVILAIIFDRISQAIGQRMQTHQHN